ncbi:hypothetical protein [Janthinobacterium sp. PC23-8]|uniref:hypothetical protein n=1 Tax=Janthinobacterium sp. PC23-8 TaxID=2012679 RepID=UPI000B9748E7|nr:hypothetical protein [Janthinobacterium sp. PC23-8]OYO27854.1 hypothetical protein CD932_22320 [Janthinobacterium sp. PC23-8]
MNDTTARSEQYRGFTISVTPQKDHDDLWDFTYHLQRDAGAGGEAKDIERSRTLGGYSTPETACVAGLEVARTEVDNLLRP